MRRGLLLGAALGVINAGAVVLLSWVTRRRGDFGWYSYTPMPRRYADYAPTGNVVNGWAAVALVVGVLIAVNVVLVTAYFLVRRRTSRAAR